jgi:hypothetical protein
MRLAWSLTDACLAAPRACLESFLHTTMVEIIFEGMGDNSVLYVKNEPRGSSNALNFHGFIV